MTLKTLEIRCPIYGFISLDDWEMDIISAPQFQRLRRIRQLGWTDIVYPGAMHTRFEHSLGVMHMATLLYDSVARRSKDVLSEVYGYNEHGTDRYRHLIRLAALLHDVGHGPFSHGVEELTPIITTGLKPRHYRHEEYSTAIIRTHFKDLIENHKRNTNYHITADEVAGLIEGKQEAGQAAVWQELVSSQLDADRMDYLLRDSYHAGVDYGKYDWRRLVNTVELVQDPESEEWRLGITDGGRHVAEALIIARYMMFSQIYFHKVRVILDHHLHNAVKELLPAHQFPPPTSRASLDEYLEWDDWKVLGLFSMGKGGDHARRLKDRNFYKLVYETSEFQNPADVSELEEAQSRLAQFGVVKLDASKSWYKPGTGELPVSSGSHAGRTRLLSATSGVVGRMIPSNRSRLYVPLESRHAAKRSIEDLTRT